MAIITELTADLKNYIDVNRDAISHEIRYGEEEQFVREFTTFVTEAQAGEKVGLPTFRLSEVSQPFQVAYTPKGTPTFSANLVTMRRIKIDHSILPDEIVGKWTAHLMEAGYDETRARTEMPITRYILDEAVKAISDEREDDYIYAGVYAAPTPGTPGAASTSYDGLHQIVKNAIIAGDLTAEPLGAFTASDIFEYFEEMFDAVPSKYRMKPLNMYVSPENYLLYGRDKRTNFAWQQRMEDLLGIDFGKVTIKPVHAMAGSNRIIITLPGNLARMVGRATPGQNLDVQGYERTVKLLTDWHEAVGVRDFEFMWVNDQL